MAVSNQDAATLAKMLPALMEWVRYKFPLDGGDLVLAVSSKKVDERSGKALQALFKLNKQHASWTSNQLREVLANEAFQGQDTWPQCVWRILQSIRGSLVNEHTFEGLESALGGGGKEDAEAVSLALMRTTYTSYQTLESLAFLLHDLSGDAGKTAAAQLGPKVLLDKKLEKRKGDAAGKILGFLVAQCVVLFGEIRCTKDFGTRLHDMVPKAAVVVTVEDKRAAGLAEFYKALDPGMQGIEKTLFEHFYFEDIARGLYVKYSCVPSGWVEDLGKMDEVKAWFTPGILTEKSPDILAKKPRSKPFMPPNPRAKAEYAADEVIDSEQFYFNKLNAFIKKYIKAVREYSSSASPEQLEEILLKEQEINRYFGDQFRAILSDTTVLLKQLEVVNLVRVPRTKSDLGRPGIVASILFNNATKLKETYAPYNGMFPATRRFVHGKVMKSQQKNKKKKKYTDFIDLWNQISSGDEFMSGLTIETMIMEPIQRYPRYVILLKTLLKEVKKEKGEDHADYAIAKKAHAFFDQMTQQLDKEIRRQEKIEEMKGSAEVVEAKSRRQAKAKSRQLRS